MEQNLSQSTAGSKSPESITEKLCFSEKISITTDILNRINIDEIKHHLWKYKITVQFNRIRLKHGTYLKIITDCSNSKLIRYAIRKFNEVHQLKLNILNSRKTLKESEAPVQKLTEGIKIISININHLDNKAIELLVHLEDINAQIVFIQETHKKTPSNPSDWPGFSILECCATDNIGENGMLILIKNELSKMVEPDTVGANTIGIKIRDNSGGYVRIVNVYVPCDGPLRNKTQAKSKKLLENESKRTMIIGDWNCKKEKNILALKSQMANVFYSSNNCGGSRVMCGVETESIIDYCVTNIQNALISETRIKTWYLSDHYAVEVIANIETTSSRQKIENTDKIDRKKFLNPKTIKNVNEFEYSMLENEHNSIQDNFNSFYTDLNKCFEKNGILSKTKNHPKKLYNNRLKHLIRSKELASNNEERDNINKMIKNEIRLMTRERCKKILDEGKAILKDNNPRSMWKWIKGLTRQNSAGQFHINIRDKESGELVNQTDDILKLAKDHFENLARKESNPYVSETKEWTVNEVCEQEISWSEILAVLKGCRNNKAMSSDGIPCELFKVATTDVQGTGNLSKVLLKLFNRCFDMGFIPEQWKNNHIVMIYKKDDPTELDNYRGITIINTLSKIFLKVIAKRINEYNNTYNIVGKHQIGFIPNEEALSGVMSLTEICQRRRLASLTTFIGFIDLRKAYDLVPHGLLIERMNEKHLGSKIIKLTKALYSDTKMMVKYNGSYSSLFKYSRGVRQGCPLSPMLFDIFIDGILQKMKKIDVPGLNESISGICYADDTLILADSAKDLQDKLNILEEWVKISYMEISLKKCGVMSIQPIKGVRRSKSSKSAKVKEKSPRETLDRWINIPAKSEIIKSKKVEKRTHEMQSNNLLNYGIEKSLPKIKLESDSVPVFRYGDEEIPIVNEYTYLGTKFNNSLDLNKMAKFRINHGWQSLEMLKPVLSNRAIPYEYKILLIKGILFPRLAYGLQIVGLRIYCMSGLKKIIDKAIGLMVGRKNFCRSRTYQEFNICNIEEIAHYYMIKSFKSWKKSKSIAQNLVKSTEYCLKRFQGKKSWCMNALNYTVKNNIDINLEKQKIKKEVCNIFKEKPRFNPINEINSFATRLSLKSGKSIYRKEFSKDHNKAYDTIIKMRQGLFKLEGDYKRMGLIKDECLGKCLSCKREIKESIEHLLLDCEAFESERKTFLSQLRELALIAAPSKARDLTLSFILDGQMQLKCKKEKVKEIYKLKMAFLLKFTESRRKHILDARL
jgi:hypothetical protein